MKMTKAQVRRQIIENRGTVVQFRMIDKQKAYYSGVLNRSNIIWFKIPISDMSNYKYPFMSAMDAQDLMQWFWKV